MIATIVGGIGSCSDEHMGGGWWWVMGIGWLIFLAAIVTVVVLLTRGHRPPPDTGRSAQGILDERFARGEIDVDEYQRRRSVLRG